MTFNYSDVNSELLATCLSEGAGIATRRGLFCAHPYVFRLMGIDLDGVVESFENCGSLKTPGMIRLSFGIYNTEEEIDKFLEALPMAREDAKVLNALPMYVEAIEEY